MKCGGPLHRCAPCKPCATSTVGANPLSTCYQRVRIRPPNPLGVVSGGRGERLPNESHFVVVALQMSAHTSVYDVQVQGAFEPLMLWWAAVLLTGAKACVMQGAESSPLQWGPPFSAERCSSQPWHRA